MRTISSLSACLALTAAALTVVPVSQASAAGEPVPDVVFMAYSPFGWGSQVGSGDWTANPGSTATYVEPATQVTGEQPSVSVVIPQPLADRGRGLTGNFPVATVGAAPQLEVRVLDKKGGTLLTYSSTCTGPFQYLLPNTFDCRIDTTPGVALRLPKKTASVRLTLTADTTLLIQGGGGGFSGVLPD
jgi:hypothetical protein